MKIKKIANVGAIVAKVIDNFLSTSGVDALSAGKGKDLNDRLALVEADSGWQYPTMINSWVNRPENSSPIRYRKIGKVVYIYQEL